MRYRSLAVSGVLLISVAASGMEKIGAQEFPQRTVTISSPFAPGSAPDVSARVMAPLLSERWSVPIVVENKVGANGNIAMAAVSRAAPDGTTLVMAPDTTICINPFVYKSAAFNPAKDLVPIASVVSNQFMLLTRADLPASNLSEFVALARASRPSLLYGSIGVGSLHHLAMEMLKRRAGIDLTHVPYRGGNAALNAILGGEVQATFSGASSAGLISSGKLRVLAMTGSHRSKGFPDLPSLGEIYPGYAIDAWIGLFAPAALPQSILARMRKDVRDVLQNPAFVDRIDVSGGLEPLLLSTEDFEKTIQVDCSKYREVVKENGISLP